MKSLLNWLSKPYYFNPSAYFKFKISLIIGVFVFVFLYIFTPFYIHLLDNFILEYTLGIGVFTFFSSFFMLFVPPLIFKNYFNEDRWTIGKNIVLIIISIFLIGSCLWYFATIYLDGINIKNTNLLQFLTYTFLVGLMPVLFVISINEKNIREKREKRAEEINFIKKSRSLIKENLFIDDIVIYSENKKEFIELNINNLVYITSQGNYASFFLKKENDLKEIILRVTLNKIALALEKHQNIIRCHKSYIVNTTFIEDVSGNARGYLLKSNLIPFDIPVSRNFSKQSLLGLLR